MAGIPSHVWPNKPSSSLCLTINPRTCSLFPLFFVLITTYYAFRGTTGPHSQTGSCTCMGPRFQTGSCMCSPVDWQPEGPTTSEGSAYPRPYTPFGENRNSVLLVFVFFHGRACVTGILIDTAICIELLSWQKLDCMYNRFIIYFAIHTQSADLAVQGKPAYPFQGRHSV
jgi:hypothetical protein